ncbi:MAG: hypothetical protein ACTSV7_12850, partial [Candidatus Baldrarchaeia archaeon]
VVEREINNIQGTPGEGLKRAILNIVVKQVQDFSLIRTIDSALTFFERHNIDVNLIKNLCNNDSGNRTLVVQAASEIYNVSYIKAVLWLYGCGIGRTIVPPNSHVKRFLTECGYSGFGWSRDEPEDWQIFTLACARMLEVAQQISDELGRHITPKQAQAAVWYLQTCRGLLPRRYSQRLSPRILIDFLQTQKWNISYLDSRLADIEELEDVAKQLKDFLELYL